MLATLKIEAPELGFHGFFRIPTKGDVLIEVTHLLSTSATIWAGSTFDSKTGQVLAYTCGPIPQSCHFSRQAGLSC